MKDTNNFRILPRKIPDWLLEQEGITGRQWKESKRKELKAIIDAFNVYRFGAAYCPQTSGEVGQIQDALDKLKASHSVKNWGR